MSGTYVEVTRTLCWAYQARLRDEKTHEVVSRCVHHHSTDAEAAECGARLRGERDIREALSGADGEW